MNKNLINSTYLSVIEKIGNIQTNFFNDNKLSVNLKSKIKSRTIKISLQNYNPLHFDFIEFIDDKEEKIDIKSIHSSSCYKDNHDHSPDALLTKKKNNGRNSFHTKSEESPWIIFIFNGDVDLRKIKIYSSSGNYNSRLDSLTIQSSQDFSLWNTIFDSWELKKIKHSNNLEKAFINLYYKDSKNINDIINETKKTNYHNANEIYYLSNKIASLKGLTLTSHGLSKSFGQMRKEDKSIFYKALESILSLLKEYGLVAFPSSGTLLGLVRDGRLIDHDDDLDICYISNFTNERDILEERKGLVDFLTSKDCKVKESDIAHYWCITSEGVSVDIFTAFNEDTFCSMNPIGRKKILKNNMFPFIKIKTSDYHNFEFEVPMNYKEILTLNYGPNWKVKDPLWSFDWSKSKKQFNFLYFNK